MGDATQAFVDCIQQAYRSKTAVRMRGCGSKSFLRLSDKGTPLSTLEHSGVVDYEPTELVITVRAGTPLADIETTLRANNQMMAFEPPLFDSGTIGGAVACGLSGPRRPWAGAVRDFILGTRVINGKGEYLSFGGQVMKNVAGYDVSRLMTGAYGVLGLITEVSMKVLPLPERETTRVFELSRQEAIDFMSRLGNGTTPLSGACWLQDRLTVRLSGTSSGVHQSITNLGGETLKQDDIFWQNIRNHHHAFFQDSSYWRLSLPPATPDLDFNDPGTAQMIDWGGAQRWVKTTDNGPDIQALATQHGGYAEHFRSADKACLRAPLSDGIQRIHMNLKKAFDPAGILNPGCFYPGL